MTTPVFTSSAGAMQFVVGKAGKVGFHAKQLNAQWRHCNAAQDGASLRHAVAQSIMSSYLPCCTSGPAAASGADR